MTNTSHWLSVSLLLLFAGCGTDLNSAILLAGESGARTFLDILVSDLYSDLPDLLALPDTAPDNADDGADVPIADDGPPDESEPDVVAGDGGPSDGGSAATGDAANGETVFGSNFCAGCHCDDASGGCLPSAPSLRGVAVGRLQQMLQGDTSHTGGKFPDLTGQDLADLAAFLSSF